MRISIKRPLLVVGAMLLNFSVLAAGINSTGYTCPALQALITAKGFIFIDNPNIRDFVVSNVSFCNGGQQIVILSVPTTDRAQCPVNYCGPERGNRAQ